VEVAIGSIAVAFTVETAETISAVAAVLLIVVWRTCLAVFALPHDGHRFQAVVAVAVRPVTSDLQSAIVAAGVIAQQATSFRSVVATISTDAAIAAFGSRSSLFVTKRAIIAELAFPSTVTSAVATSGIRAFNTRSMAITIFVVGATQSAERRAFKAISTEFAVRRSEKVRRTSGALGVGPVVAADTIAFRVVVAGDVGSIVGAVSLVCTSFVATVTSWIVQFISSSATTAVVVAIVVGSARTAVITTPFANTGAGAL
jgi:hypothetical protein